MATNVTEKENVLNDIFAYCETKMNALWHDIGGIEATTGTSDEVALTLRGQVKAYEDIAGKCHRLLVSIGSIPVEGENDGDQRD